MQLLLQRSACAGPFVEINRDSGRASSSLNAQDNLINFNFDTSKPDFPTAPSHPSMDLSLPPVVSANTNAIELDLSLGDLFGADANPFFAHGYSGLGVVEEDPLLSDFDILTMRNNRAGGGSVRKTAPDSTLSDSMIDEDVELDDGLAGLDAVIGAIDSDIHISGTSALPGGVDCVRKSRVLRIANETQPVDMASDAATHPSSSRRESNCIVTHGGTAPAVDGDNGATLGVEVAVFRAPSPRPIDLPTKVRNLQEGFSQPQLAMLPTEEAKNQMKQDGAIRVPVLQPSSMRPTAISTPIALSVDPLSNCRSLCKSDDANNRNTNIIHNVPHSSNLPPIICQQSGQVKNDSYFGDTTVVQDASTATTISNCKSTALISSFPSDSRALSPDLLPPPPPSELSSAVSSFSLSADSSLYSTTPANLTPSNHPIELATHRDSHRQYEQQSQQVQRLIQIEKPPLKPIKIKFKPNPTDPRLSKVVPDYREHQLKHKRKRSLSPLSRPLPNANGIDVTAAAVAAAKAAISSAHKRLRLTVSAPLASVKRGDVSSGSHTRPVPSHSKITLLEKTGLISGPESLLLRVRREVERIERAVLTASGARGSTTPSSSSSSSGSSDSVSCTGDYGSRNGVGREPVSSRESLHANNTNGLRERVVGDAPNGMMTCSILNTSDAAQCELKLENLSEVPNDLKETNESNLCERPGKVISPVLESTPNRSVRSVLSARAEALQDYLANSTEMDSSTWWSLPVNESTTIASQNFEAPASRPIVSIVESSEIPSPSPLLADAMQVQDHTRDTRRRRSTTTTSIAFSATSGSTKPLLATARNGGRENAKSPKPQLTRTTFSPPPPPPVTSVNTVYRISEKKILRDFFARAATELASVSKSPSAADTTTREGLR
ncbi:hypothetical protein HDU84_005437 [Entophlyctis sp. JEL0112]|nr:hypothetical protein HDU84_005437 [Entophlyctis sp. JEL0112]